MVVGVGWTRGAIAIGVVHGAFSGEDCSAAQGRTSCSVFVDGVGDMMVLIG